MGLESDTELLDAVLTLVADLEVGGEREWAGRLREALAGGVVSGGTKEDVRSVLRTLRTSGPASGPARAEIVGTALAYLDQVLGQEPQY